MGASGRCRAVYKWVLPRPVRRCCAGHLLAGDAATFAYDEADLAVADNCVCFSLPRPLVLASQYHLHRSRLIYAAGELSSLHHDDRGHCVPATDAETGANVRCSFSFHGPHTNRGPRLGRATERLQTRRHFRIADRGGVRKLPANSAQSSRNVDFQSAHT